MTTIASKLAYPATRTGPEQDVIYGRTVQDPYRWLEDPDAPDVVAWVQAQNECTKGYFEGFAQTRQAARARLQELQNYERVGCPTTRGDNSYFSRNTGLQNQDVVYRLPRSVFASQAVALEKASTFLDLNAEYPDGTTALGSTGFSEDGRFYVYGLSSGGSDWQTLRVKDTATNTDLPSDVIPWTKFTRIAWTHDNAGFFYSRHPAPAPPAASATGSVDAGTETQVTSHCMVMYHRVGTSPERDVLVYANASQPLWRFSVEVSDDGAYLLLTTHKGTDPVNKVFFAGLGESWQAWLAAAQPASVSLGAPGSAQSQLPPATYAYLPLVRVIDNFDAEYDYITNDDGRFYFKTNLGAPRYRIVELDFAAAAAAAPPAAAAGEALAVQEAKENNGPTPAVGELVAEGSGSDVLDWAAAVAGSHMLLCYLRNATNVLVLRGLPVASSGGVAATAVEVPLPAPGTIVSVSGRRDQNTAFVKFVSFLHPGSVLRLSFRPDGATAAAPPAPSSDAPFVREVACPSGPTTLEVRSMYETRVAGFSSSDFVSRQVFVPSTDGTVQLPVFIVSSTGSSSSSAGGAGSSAAAPRPTLLYAYGGFNVSLQPTFSALRLLWLKEFGGTYVMACLRGGGEGGESWHLAGSRLNKQNVFDDLYAVADHLIAQGITTPKQLGVMGGSNGGLLACVAALQRPALWGAAVAQVPVTDMLRYHMFTVGGLWRGEYGFVEDKADAEAMLRYSPLHNVTPVTTPAEELPSILITTADHDDRVVPLHSLKMAATLQSTAVGGGAQTRPLLIRIETKAGHGAGKPVGKVLDEYADVWSFLAHELGAKWGGN